MCFPNEINQVNALETALLSCSVLKVIGYRGVFRGSESPPPRPKIAFVSLNINIPSWCGQWRSQLSQSVGGGGGGKDHFLPDFNTVPDFPETFGIADVGVRIRDRSGAGSGVISHTTMRFANEIVRSCAVPSCSW